MSCMFITLNHFQFFDLFNQIIYIFITSFDLFFKSYDSFFILFHLNCTLRSDVVYLCSKLDNSLFLVFLILMRSNCEILNFFLKIFLFFFVFLRFIIQYHNGLLRFSWIVIHYFDEPILMGVIRWRKINRCFKPWFCHKPSRTVMMIVIKINRGIGRFRAKKIFDVFWYEIFIFLELFWCCIPFEFPLGHLFL